MASSGEVLRANQRLRRNPAQFVRLAKAGSTYDVVAISDAIGIKPELQTVEIIRMFCSHLDASKTPSPRMPLGPGDQIHCNNAAPSLTALQVVGIDTPTLLAPIKRAWPGIFNWMVFFVEIDGHPGIIRPTKLWDTVTFICYRLIFDDDDAIRKAMLHTPGFAAFIASIWMRGKAKAALRRTGVVASILFRILYDASHDCFDEVIRGAGGSVEDVAKHAISDLRWVLKTQSPSTTDIYSYVNIVASLIRFDEDIILRTMWDNGVVTIVTHTLRTLSDLHLPENFEVVDGMSVCFQVLDDVMQLGDAVRQVRQMVKGGLLQAIVEISATFDDLDNMAPGPLLSLVEDVIPNYLLLRSVLLAVESALSSLSPPDYSTSLQRSPSLWVAWESMVRIFHQNADRIHAIDNGKMARCDECRTNVKADGRALKRCAGCQLARYCSKECQIIAWEATHKTECRIILQRRLGPQVLSAGDLLCHQGRMDIDAYSYVGEIRKIALENWPGTPFSEIGILLDYTQCDQGTITAYPWLLSDTENLPIPADEMQLLVRDSQTAVVGRVRLGPKIISLIIPVAQNIWDHSPSPDTPSKDSNGTNPNHPEDADDVESDRPVQSNSPV